MTFGRPTTPSRTNRVTFWRTICDSFSVRASGDFASTLRRMLAVRRPHACVSATRSFSRYLTAQNSRPSAPRISLRINRRVRALLTRSRRSIPNSFSIRCVGSPRTSCVIAAASNSAGRIPPSRVVCSKRRTPICRLKPVTPGSSSAAV